MRVYDSNPPEVSNDFKTRTYLLEVSFSSDIDIIEFTKFDAVGGTERAAYPEGVRYRIDQSKTNKISAIGKAFYYDSNGIKQPAINVRIRGTCLDEQWKEHNRPDLATVENYCYTDIYGNYKLVFDLNSALGGLSHYVTISTHYYDSMNVSIYTDENTNIDEVIRFFYYLKYCNIQ